MELKKWLRYWRTSLADIDRRHLKLDDKKTTQLAALDAPALQAFYAQQLSLPDAPADAEPLLVLLAPFSLRPAVGDNRRTAAVHKTLHPFWVPARLTEDGTLLPPTEDEPLIPWLVREVLEPADRNYPVLSSIELLDAELALWNWNFATATWPSYRANAEAFYGRVCATTGWPADRMPLGEWVADRNFTLTRPPARGMSAGVIGLYNYLEKQPALPQLLTTVLQGRLPATPLDPTDSAVLLTKGHYGQMSDQYPLSSSQRFTLQALLTTAPGDVFPVNGPPGTGKTTLLQSVVANLVVEKALLGGEAPRVLASSPMLKSAGVYLISLFTVSGLYYLGYWGQLNVDVLSLIDEQDIVKSVAYPLRYAGVVMLLLLALALVIAPLVSRSKLFTQCQAKAYAVAYAVIVLGLTILLATVQAIIGFYGRSTDLLTAILLGLSLAAVGALCYVRRSQDKPLFLTTAGGFPSLRPHELEMVGLTTVAFLGLSACLTGYAEAHKIRTGRRFHYIATDLLPDSESGRVARYPGLG